MRPNRFLPAPAAVVLILALFAGPAVAVPPEADPDPVLVVNQTAFRPLLDGEILGPGQRIVRELRAGGFASVRLLARARSGGEEGGVTIEVGFGPPAIPAARFAIRFDGDRRSARRLLPVFGPKMTVIVVNRSVSAAEVSLSVYLTQ